MVDAELGWPLVLHEERPVGEHRVVRPALREVDVPLPCVHAERRERRISKVRVSKLVVGTLICVLVRESREGRVVRRRGWMLGGDAEGG